MDDIKLPDLSNRIKRIQNGSGLYRDNIPASMVADMAKHLWNNCEFSYGMEYGYLLAMNDLINNIDSTSSSTEKGERSEL